MSVKIKLCGFKNLEDINFAFHAGIDYIGLNNITISKRFLTNDEIISLVTKLSLEYRAKIIVLLNHLDRQLLEKLKELGVEYIQSYLIEKEDQELFDMGFKVIKVFCVASKDDLDDIKKFDFSKYSYCLLDTKVEGSLGGTGRNFDWQLFIDLDLSMEVEMILAGGLNLQNVNQALATTKANFIDLASGVEDEAGHKSYASIQELARIVKA